MDAAGAVGGQADARQLERAVQTVLDDYRAKDISAAQARYGCNRV